MLAILKRLLYFVVLIVLVINLSFSATIDHDPNILVPVRIKASVDPQDGVIGTSFTINTSGTTQDPRNEGELEYRINCDVTKVYQYNELPQWTTSTSNSCSYDQTGKKYIKVDARDQYGQIDSVQLRVIVKNNMGPRIYIYANKVRGYDNEMFAFRPDTVSTVDGEVTVRWDFDGDGNFDTDYEIPGLKEYRFPEGIYRVRAEAKDSAGITGLSSMIKFDGKEYQKIVVQKSERVKAKFTINPEEGSQYTTFLLDASAAFTPRDYELFSNNKGISFRWDINGDDDPDTNWSTNPKLKTQLEPGERKITLFYRFGNEESKASKIITVKEAESTDIKLDAKINNEAGSTMHWVFDATRTLDPNYTLEELEFRWDFDDSDGSYWDTGWSNDTTTKYEYKIPGTKVIRLEARNKDKITTRYTKRIEVFQNTRPKPFFWVDKLISTKSHEFLFDASKSRDYETPIPKLKYRWDFNGDDIFDTEWTASPFAKYKYDIEGKKKVIMEVIDEYKASSRIMKQVTVAKNTNPELKFTVSPETGHTNTNYIIDLNDSFDLDTPKEQLLTRISWNNDEITTPWANNFVYFNKFNKDGDNFFRIEIADADGGVTTKTGKVYNHWVYPYYFYAKESGWISSPTLDAFNPTKKITTGEFLMLVMIAKGIEPLGTDMINEFADVKGALAPYFATAVHNRYITKTDNYYPNRIITIAEALRILFGVLGMDYTIYDSIGVEFSDVKRNDWFYSMALFSDEKNIWKAIDNYFLPYKQVNRGMSIALLKRALEASVNSSNIIAPVIDETITNTNENYGLDNNIDSTINTPTTNPTDNNNNNNTNDKLDFFSGFEDPSGVSNNKVYKSTSNSGSISNANQQKNESAININNNTSNRAPPPDVYIPDKNSQALDEMLKLINQ